MNYKPGTRLKIECPKCGHITEFIRSGQDFQTIICRNCSNHMTYKFYEEINNEIYDAEEMGRYRSFEFNTGTTRWGKDDS